MPVSQKVILRRHKLLHGALPLRSLDAQESLDDVATELGPGERGQVLRLAEQLRTDGVALRVGAHGERPLHDVTRRAIPRPARKTAAKRCDHPPPMGVVAVDQDGFDDVMAERMTAQLSYILEHSVDKRH